MTRARDLIDRFRREEDAFLRAQFVAPVGPNGNVRVRIAGIVCELLAHGDPGLCVLQPTSPREARVVRQATKTEARRYLELFPRARLVAAFQLGPTWFALPASAPAKGVRVEGIVPIAYAQNVQLFQTVVCRFDGSLFLEESTQRHADAAYLRDELRKMTSVAGLTRKGLTDPERAAYAHQLKLQEELSKTVDERRLERALKLAGATLERCEQQHGSFVVTYRVDGEPYTSVVSKKNLTVVSAGVCLSGRDGDFDLTSLVSVLRERRRLGEDD